MPRRWWETLRARLRPLYRWFERYTVLFTMAALVLGFLMGLAGSLGVPDLFWDEHLGHQLFAGLGVGLLVADLGLIGFLLERHEPWLNQLGDPGLLGLDRRSDRALVRYLLRTSAVVWVVVAASASAAPEGVPALPLVAGAALGLVALPGLVLLVKRGSLVRDLAVRTLPVGILPREALEQPELDALAFVYALAKLVLYLGLWGASSLGWSLSVGFVICLLLGLVSSLYGYLKYALVAGAHRSWRSRPWPSSS